MTDAAVPADPWAADVVPRVVSALGPLANPESATRMAAYLKGVAPFLGMPRPPRVAACRPVWKAIGPAPSEAALAVAAFALFARPEREFHYAAIDLVKRQRQVCTADALVHLAEPLICATSWWDTVDALQGSIVGPLVGEHPSLVGVIRRWSGSGNRWLVRSAILHQLHRKTSTDVDLLFDPCRRHADSTEFFIAKAIGWELREYSYSDPSAVEAFVATTPLRPLSAREGMKAIVRRRARSEKTLSGDVELSPDASRGRQG